jgi:selenocysteine lyase/cysteine desulfurase
MKVPSSAESASISESSTRASQPETRRAGAFSAQLLEAIRERFHAPTGVSAFLDSAAGSLKLKAASETLAESSRWPDNRFGPDSVPSSEILKRGANDVKTFLGASSAVVMPAMSATHAVYRMLNAILGKASGSNIVTTNLEHPAVGDSTYTLAKTYDKQRRVARVDPDTGRVSPESILRLVDRQTDALAFVHGSNVTGAIADVKAITAAARRLNPDIFIIVDGVQYASHHWVGVDDLGVDAYVFSPYKVFTMKG